MSRPDGLNLLADATAGLDAAHKARLDAMQAAMFPDVDQQAIDLLFDLAMGTSEADAYGILVSVIVQLHSLNPTPGGTVEAWWGKGQEAMFAEAKQEAIDLLNDLAENTPPGDAYVRRVSMRSAREIQEEIRILSPIAKHYDTELQSNDTCLAAGAHDALRWALCLAEAPVSEHLDLAATVTKEPCSVCGAPDQDECTCGDINDSEQPHASYR